MTVILYVTLLSIMSMSLKYYSKMSSLS
uniref:Uncharacterized protein n=1 Tax=Anguilla anguilla TaxID=7936 RepID=A0A0E9P9D4_ANGAN